MQLLKPMDFGFFFAAYDPADPVRHPGLLRGVYWPDDKSFGTLYGLVNTEPRIASYIGIARGQLPPEHYYRINRTWRPGGVPREQGQSPRGESRSYLGVDVFEGHYTYRGTPDRAELGGQHVRGADGVAVRPRSPLGAAELGGQSPALRPCPDRARPGRGPTTASGASPRHAGPGAGYRTYGVDAIGVDPQGYTSDDGNATAGTGKGPGAVRRRCRDPACIVPGLAVRPASGDGQPAGPRRQVPDLRPLRIPRFGERLHRQGLRAACWRWIRG